MGKTKRAGRGHNQAIDGRLAPEPECQRRLKQRIADNRADWARRHPDMAADERRLRKGRAELLANWKHKNAGTPETHEAHEEATRRRNRGALARLYQSGAIDCDQLNAAEEIAIVAERIGADVAVKTASLETRVDVTRCNDGSVFELIGQVRREMAYTEWRARLSHPAAVLDMLVGEPVGFTVIAARYRMHHRKAKRLLIDALDLWPEILGGVRKAVDQKDLDRQHARLAA
jgi:hypothetical protein